MSPPPATPAKPNRLNDPLIVERHAAPIGEVVLVKGREPGWFDVQFVTSKIGGQFERKSLLLIKGTKDRVARRMMDFHAGICAAQHAARAER